VEPIVLAANVAESKKAPKGAFFWSSKRPQAFLTLAVFDRQEVVGRY
jgi:hypothetical protein